MEPEFELWHTNALAEQRYFDIEIAYAKTNPRRYFDSRNRDQPRTAASDPAFSADDLVSQYLELGP